MGSLFASGEVVPERMLATRGMLTKGTKGLLTCIVQESEGVRGSTRVSGRENDLTFTDAF